MKKLQFALLFLGVIPVLTLAADLEQRINVGIGSTKLNIDTFSESSQFGMGIQIGYEGVRKIDEKQGVSFGVEYNTINTDHQYDTGSDLVKYKTKTSWLALPVLYRHTVDEKVTVLAGGYLALGLNKEIEVGGETAALGDGIKDMDYGLIVGAECKFTKNIFGIVQYRMGLADLNDLEDASATAIKTSQIRCGIGYAF